MKNFTKTALIIVLVLVILGSLLCAVGLGIGFRFSEFWDQVETGEFSIGPIHHIPFFSYNYSDYDWADPGDDWDAADEEVSYFPWEDIKKIKLDVDYSSVIITEDALGRQGGQNNCSVPQGRPQTSGSVRYKQRKYPGN